MTDGFFDNCPKFLCACGHLRRRHWNTAAEPNGPCYDCGCTAFSPEAMCRCGHGKKAHEQHPKGHCKEAYKCGCKGFQAT